MEAAMDQYCVRSGGRGSTRTDQEGLCPATQAPTCGWAAPLEQAHRRPRVSSVVTWTRMGADET